MFLHINNTMVILLKAASVWVSSIQIMQVRVQNKGKSVRKSRSDGDVSIGLQGEFFDGREPNREATADKLKMLQYNAQACDIFFNGLCLEEFNKNQPS